MNWDLQIEKLANIRRGDRFQYWDSRTTGEQWCCFIGSESGLTALPFQFAIEESIAKKRIVTFQKRYDDGKFAYFIVGI
jgi:hypothetical protein